VSQTPPPGLPPEPPLGVGPPAVTPRQTGNKTGLVVIIALLVAGVGVGAFLVLRDDGQGGAAGTPEGAVRSFFEAVQQQDCEAVVDLMTEESWAFIVRNTDEEGPPESVTREEAVSDCNGQDEDEFGASDTLDEVEVLSETDTTATLQVTFTAEGDEEPTITELVLVKQDDIWKLDVPAISAGL
jgi:hypothetical protein